MIEYKARRVCACGSSKRPENTVFRGSSLDDIHETGILPRTDCLGWLGTERYSPAGPLLAADSGLESVATGKVRMTSVPSPKSEFRVRLPEMDSIAARAD